MTRLMLASIVAPLVWAAPPLVAAPASPGVVFEIETVASATDTPRMVQAAVEGQNARIRMAGQQSDAIYRGDRHEMVVINHGNKSFMVLDKAAVEQIASQMSRMMEQMQQMMQNMPEEQRQAMENAMKGRGMSTGAPEPPAELRRTAEQAVQNGFPTVKYEVLRGGKKTQELWVTPWSNVQGFAEARPVFESMAGFFKDLMSRIPQMGAAPEGEAFSYFDRIDGFPVVTQNFDEAGNPTSKSTLKSVKSESVPASDFEPPAGYTEQRLPQMGPGQQ